MSWSGLAWSSPGDGDWSLPSWVVCTYVLSFAAGLGSRAVRPSVFLSVCLSVSLTAAAAAA